MGTAPTERVKLRRQVAAAAGNKSTTSLSLLMEALLGRRSLDGNMVSGPLRGLDETGSRSSDVEAGKRTCRSSDV